MPTLRAPSTSDTGESPTCSASSGLALRPCQGQVEDGWVRLLHARVWRRDYEVQVPGQSQLRRQIGCVGAYIADQPYGQPLDAEHLKRGQRIVEQGEVVGNRLHLCPDLSRCFKVRLYAGALQYELLVPSKELQPLLMRHLPNWGSGGVHL